ncbi:alpha/beta hydrolase [Noviherbaspirillum massiliense]|uniref:alpha/beta hydrolase n=1 Tax=Noviherbaspirillum massiliense TaxID=1465823 RepID=UPI0002F2C414|nr:alpha/beta fold hydrolase [Noviherbaspirillum massiliense]
MPTIDTNGITLTYDTQGDSNGKALVLIAGLGLQLISWPEAFCRELADQGFHVIRFDNRDSGLSTKLEHLGKPNLPMAVFKSMFHLPLFPGYTLQDMARDTIGLLDGLGIDKAHIVGASMGGMIAQILAADHPERVSTLTSIMSTSGRPGLPGPMPSARDALFSRPENPRNMQSVIEYFVRAYRTIGSPKYPVPDEVLREQVTRSVRRNVCPQGTARQMMAVMASGDRSPALRKISVPTLVIHGADDPLVPLACGRDTARWIPGAVLHEVEGMGHDIPPALEASLAKLIATHCKGEPGPRARRA